MIEIIKTLTKEYENSGYLTVKKCFDDWMNVEKNNFSPKDEATVKLFMARLCLAQDKLDDLQEFFSTGMSQAEKEEIESLKSKVQELEKLIVQKDYELENLRKASEKTANEIAENANDKFISFIEKKCLKFSSPSLGEGYVCKETLGPYSPPGVIKEVLQRLPVIASLKRWTLVTAKQLSEIQRAADGNFIFGENETFSDTYDNGYIHPVLFLSEKKK